MNAFIKSVKGTVIDDNSRIKSVITSQLSEVVKEIQLCSLEENMLGDSLDFEEAANSLCCIIEAMFLHGLKDSLVLRFRKAIADVDDRPDPSFWPPLLVISHRQIIDLVIKCPHLTTEVGQCRAWIRLALNDCLLSSYLLTLRQNSTLLRSYYNSHAYVRDSDLLEVAQRLIEGVETVKTFNLPCYSSILNTWPPTTLMLTGVWSPTLRACPVQTCIDIAQSVQTSGNAETSSMSSMGTISSQNSGLGNMVAFNEEEVFKIILNKRLSEGPPNSESDFNSKVDPTPEQISPEEATECSNITVEGEKFIGNSLCGKSGWSFNEAAQSKEDKSSVLFHSCESPVEGKVVSSTGNLEHSFNALIESYNMFGGTQIRTPDIREVWNHFERGTSPTDNISEKLPLKLSMHEQTFNITNEDTESKTSEMKFTQQLTNIAVENGLDSQNYECAECKVPLTLNKTTFADIINHANVCAFTGKYFCDNCMHSTSIAVPARIVHNWDHKEYKVSRAAYNYMKEIKDHPYIDLKIKNPYIYAVVEDMTKLLMLRNQLNFLRAYLYTCRDPIIGEFQKLMWPREYMYEHIHQYSIQDLQQVPDGTLANKLQDVVNFGKKHVLDCCLCSHKGFLCEVCNSSKVLFPFDVENVYRCDGCNAVYHKGCLDETKPCPKCKRQREREDMSLLGMTSE